MRVIECNECGETLSAANDEELRDCLREHMSSRHPGTEIDDEQVGELVSQEAYSAMDS